MGVGMGRGGEGEGVRVAPGNEAALTCLAQSSLLRLSPSCSSSRSWLTLSRSFCSRRPCQTETPDLSFSSAGGDYAYSSLPQDPTVGLVEPPKWRDTVYFLISLLPSSGLLKISSSFLPAVLWAESRVLHRLGSALPRSHTPSPLFSFVLGISHHIIFYSIPTHALPNFLCREGTSLPHWPAHCGFSADLIHMKGSTHLYLQLLPLAIWNKLVPRRG